MELLIIFKFKRNKDPIVTAVRGTIGTREKYINFTKKYPFTFTEEEKDTLLQASIQANKKIPDMNIIQDAYELMIAAGDIEGEEEKSANEEEKVGEKSISDTNTKKNKKSFMQKLFKWLTPGIIIFIILLILSNFTEELGTPGIAEVMLILVITLLIWGFKLLFNFIVADIDEPRINSAREQYRIYVNPQGEYKAVKTGWSWTAFFFTGIWALVNKMWVLGIAFTTMEIFTVVSTAGFGTVLNLFWSVVLGYKGNKLLRDHLLRSGYDLVGVSHKTTADGAIAEYLKNTQDSGASSNSEKNNPTETSTSNTKDASVNLHVSDELRKLAELKKDDILTEEEFLSQKQKLLNK